MRIVGWVLALGLLQGCQCQSEIQQPPRERPTQTDTDQPDTATRGDTGPEKACDTPEIEPNNSRDDATKLPMEGIGCGTYEAPGDLDFWWFEMPSDEWLSVKVSAKKIGSNADVHMLLIPDEGAGAERLDNQDSTDAWLLFPATEQDFMVQLLEQNLQGGDRYFYEIVASVAKPPVDWCRSEVEDNDFHTSAEDLPLNESDVSPDPCRSSASDRIFGNIHDDNDADWFRLAVPSGKHTITFDVDAYSYGSAADLSLFVFKIIDDVLEPLPLGCDPSVPCGGANCCEHRGGPVGFEFDPLLAWESAGDEVLFIRLAESILRSGATTWYVLDVHLEGT